MESDDSLLIDSCYKVFDSVDNMEFDINAPVDVNTLEEALDVIPTFFNIKSDAEGEKSPPGSDDFFGERAAVHNNINNTKQRVSITA